jgi:hypothetical protein
MKPGEITLVDNFGPQISFVERLLWRDAETGHHKIGAAG